jgi:nitronate monooxygenase
MYPCSNPELVAAVSAAGGMGIVQPLAFAHVHGVGLREGLARIRSLTSRPVGMNALVESSSRIYHQRMARWVEEALEEGVRFFVTSLGKPGWVVERVGRAGGVVYHDATDRRWALKALDAGVQGLIAVNRRAGGHAGSRSAQDLLDDLGDLGVPVVCAGGVATPEEYAATLRLGYAGAQMGTRFIATHECRVSAAYKQALVDAGEDDIVLTERLTGVPLSVLATPYVRRLGTRAGPLARWMLGGRRTKRLMRAVYALRATRRLKSASLDESGGTELWQAGRSVAGIREILPAGEVVRRCAAAAGFPEPEPA